MCSKIYLLMRLIIKKNPIYVILDNFEKFQVNSKLNNSIMSIKKSLNNNQLEFCLIGINMSQESGQSLILDTIPWVHIPNLGGPF